MDTGPSESTEPRFNRANIMKELNDKGYCVVPNVLTSEECDAHIASYREWLAKFPEDEWPLQMESLVMTYRIGHFEPTWKVRLAAKPVFETLWQTKKLLSSIDSVAISPPPEHYDHPGVKAVSTFATPGYNWLHIDQSAPRIGLHCYQGAVYLEETSETDYCFRVLAKSHGHISDFYYTFPEAADRSVKEWDFCSLDEEQVQWFEGKGCQLTKVPVPKGGMVLWDSRTVHDNCRPQPGRSHSNRWRFVVFVCMAPARWCSPQDMEKKRHVYNHLRMTTHWPSQNVTYFEEQVSSLGNQASSKATVPLLAQLPEVAKSLEAQKLSGVVEYDFRDGEPNGPSWNPAWAK